MVAVLAVCVFLSVIQYQLFFKLLKEDPGYVTPEN